MFADIGIREACMIVALHVPWTITNIETLLL